MSLGRRKFLTYLGAGTLSMLLGPRARWAGAAPLSTPRASPRGFVPVKPTRQDDLILPDGFEYDLVCRWEDPLGSTGPLGPERFGFNCDFTAYFPLSDEPDSGLLWVNHEYTSPVFVARHSGGSPLTREQVRAEKLSVGGSVLRVGLREGRWTHLPGSPYARRFTALYPEIELTGPMAGRLGRASGTLANCAGGVTPWGTVLSCEEKFSEVHSKWHWNDVPEEAVNLDAYGWVVEVDPLGQLPPKKHTALGRFEHENATHRLGPNRRLVVYMGDDDEDQCLYKYVSDDAYREGAPREETRRLLERGTLYAADFANGRWLPLDLSRQPRLREEGFADQAEVMRRSRDAAHALGATPLDRTEDCEVHPLDGTLYLSLTGNPLHGDLFGMLLRLSEEGDDPEGERFRYEIFLAGDPRSGVACPDNLLFDREGNLWVCVDMSLAELHQPAYGPFGNNGLFFVPTSGPSAGEAFQFASGPVDAEFTGLTFTPDQKTMFLSVQHPGEGTRDLSSPTSRWPDGDVPRPSVVAIRGF